jgi:hypothetical protein
VIYPHSSVQTASGVHPLLFIPDPEYESEFGLALGVSGSIATSADSCLSLTLNMEVNLVSLSDCLDLQQQVQTPAYPWPWIWWRVESLTIAGAPRCNATRHTLRLITDHKDRPLLFPQNRTCPRNCTCEYLHKYFGTALPHLENKTTAAITTATQYGVILFKRLDQ